MTALSEIEKDLIAEVEKIEPTALTDEILKISQISWENPLNYDDIEDWLSNFCGSVLGSAKAERNLALWLLSGVVFFSIDDIRAYCQYLFSEFIHMKLVEYQTCGCNQNLNIEDQIVHILKSTIFLTLGNDSESGANVLYYFRQTNHLKKEIFEKDLERTYENLVFVDDITISGTQALTYIPRIQNSVSAEKTYFLTFLASETAVDGLKHIDVHTISANYLTDREKCFSPDSYVFSYNNRKKFLPIAAKMCEFYGKIITGGHPEADGYPLGYDQAQGLFCFFYNTPDNTLPIFWCEGHGWKPIFKRYEKIVDEDGGTYNDSQYYV